MAEHGVAALSHPPSGERVRTGPADPSGAWDQDHPPSTETTTQESGLRENRTSRLSERTEEGRKPDLLRLYPRRTRARASLKVGACFGYQRTHSGRRPCAASSCVAHSVTSENKPSSAGVVRRMAKSDHCRWVSRPR